MTARRATTAVALALAAVAAGCAHLPPGGDDLTYAARRDYLAGLEAWDLRGRIAIRNGDEAFQGRFLWSQRPDGLALTVRSPLGTNVLRVSGPPQQLTLEARGETRDLSDPEPQLSELVGWWLPVTSFKSWLLGIPDPGYDARERVGGDGVLDTLQQRLWDLSYSSYQLTAGVLVPRRIDLKHAQLDLRVIVDSWSPAP
jgi:outer membrane lipoprotein LolB